MSIYAASVRLGLPRSNLQPGTLCTAGTRFFFRLMKDFSSQVSFLECAIIDQSRGNIVTSPFRPLQAQTDDLSHPTTAIITVVASPIPAWRSETLHNFFRAVLSANGQRCRPQFATRNWRQQAPPEFVEAGHRNAELHLARKKSCKLPPAAFDSMNARRRYRTVNVTEQGARIA